MDIQKLSVGQEVLIKALAILNRSYKGVIREIFLAAREKKNEWSRSGDKVEFPVRIEITERDPEIRTGMSALVDVIAKKHTQVLCLKHEFIQKSGEQYFAVLLDGTRQPLKVGLQNEEVFEILEGLKEGDQVKQTDFMALPDTGAPGAGT